MVLLTVEDFHQEAKHKLPRLALNYYNGAADDERTLRRNQNAFERFLIVPRCLQDVSHVNTSTNFLGKSFSFPIAVAPTAFHKMASANGEVDTARATAKMNTLMIASSWSTVPLEKIAGEVRDHGGDLWFQLYVYKDKSVTKLLIERAVRAKCSAIVLTVDTPVLGRRLADLRHGFSLPKPFRLANFSSDMLENMPDGDTGISGFMDYVTNQIDSSLSWETVDYIKRICPLPLILKGIVRADDAAEALNHSIDGIIVSNHGGRQLDSSISTIEALPAVVHAIKGKIPVFMDGGVRNGRDIFKAIALGATAVFIGRPILWGLAVDGEQGVRKVLDILQTEFVHTMRLAGTNSIKNVKNTENLVIHDSFISKL
ncbi:unnamed protein product [Auanema sp. JU1783]|nr:unnamed protein product [Auanema sp. JU1783]